MKLRQAPIKLSIALWAMHANIVFAMKGPDACDFDEYCGSSSSNFDPFEFLVVLAIVLVWWNQSFSSVKSRLWFTGIVGGGGLLLVFNTHKFFAIFAGCVFILLTVLSWVYCKDEQNESDSLPSKNITKTPPTTKEYVAKSFMFDQGHKPCVTDAVKVAVGDINKRAIERLKKSHTYKKWSFFTPTQSIKNNLTGKIYIQGEYEFSPLRGEPGIRILADGKDSWAAHVDTEYINEEVMSEQEQDKSTENLTSDSTNPKVKFEKLKSQPLKKVTGNTYISKPCPFCGGQIAKQTMICEQCGTGFPKNPENHSYD